MKKKCKYCTNSVYKHELCYPHWLPTRVVVMNWQIDEGILTK